MTLYEDEGHESSLKQKPQHLNHLPVVGLNASVFSVIRWDMGRNKNMSRQINFSQRKVYTLISLLTAEPCLRLSFTSWKLILRLHWPIRKMLLPKQDGRASMRNILTILKWRHKDGRQGSKGQKNPKQTKTETQLN